MDKKIQIAIIASVLFLSSLGMTHWLPSRNYFIVVVMIDSVDAGSRVCKRKSLFGKIRFTCPEPGAINSIN